MWNYTTSLEYILNKTPNARAERAVARNEIVRCRAGDGALTLGRLGIPP